MHDCTTYQSQLLEHLYGLLDEVEKQALLSHLSTCAACHSAMETARHQQRLLAAAARQQFTAVRFDIPAAEEAVSPLPPPTERRSIRRWRNVVYSNARGQRKIFHREALLRKGAAGNERHSEDCGG